MQLIQASLFVNEYCCEYQSDAKYVTRLVVAGFVRLQVLVNLRRHPSSRALVTRQRGLLIRFTSRDELTDSDVTKHQEYSRVFSVDEQVLGLDIAMEYSFFVEVLQALASVVADQKPGGERDVAVELEVVVQCSLAVQLVDYITEVSPLFVVEHFDDVWMVTLLQDFDLF